MSRDDGPPAGGAARPGRPAPPDTVSRVFRSSFPAADNTAFRTGSWFRGGFDEHQVEPHYPTVLHAFVQAAQPGSHRGITLLPDDPNSPEETRTYRDLVAASQHFAGRLAAKGVRAGDRVLIVLPTSFEYVIVFFAVQLVGAIPVPSYPPAVLEKAEVAIGRLSHIASHCTARFCVTTRKLRALLGEVALAAPSITELISIERLEQEGPAADVAARARLEDTAFLQYTSGSTGHPKGVELTHKNLVYNIHAIGQAVRITRRDVAVSWLPLYHDMGLIGVLLFSVYWRLPLVLMSPMAFLMRPVRWLQAISDHGGSLSPAPNFAFARCVQRVTDAERAGLDLSSWRLALNGAEPVNRATVDRFVDRFRDVGFERRTMMPVYGLAEASLAVTFTPPDVDLHFDTVDRAALAGGAALPGDGPGAVSIASVGKPIPGNEVVIVDEEGAVLSDRQVGHIVAHGPSVMKGYFGDPEASAKILEAGWLWTGDLGYFVDGFLYVAGRAKDLIIIRGRNYYAEDIEVQAERVEGIRTGCVVAFGVYDEQRAHDKVVLVAETREADQAARATLVEQVLAQVRDACGVSIDEVVLAEPGTLPKTSSGKRQRGLTREQYLAGELGVQKTSTLGLAGVFARSGLGLMASTLRRWAGRREPD